MQCSNRDAVRAAKGAHGGVAARLNDRPRDAVVFTQDKLLARLECVKDDYFVGAPLKQVPFKGPNGERLIRRAPANTIRGEDEVALDDIALSIAEEGLQQEFSWHHRHFV